MLQRRSATRFDDDDIAADYRVRVAGDPGQPCDPKVAAWFEHARVFKLSASRKRLSLVECVASQGRHRSVQDEEAETAASSEGESRHRDQVTAAFWEDEIRRHDAETAARLEECDALARRAALEAKTAREEARGRSDATRDGNGALYRQTWQSESFFTCLESDSRYFLHRPVSAHQQNLYFLDDKDSPLVPSARFKIKSLAPAPVLATADEVNSCARTSYRVMARGRLPGGCDSAEAFDAAVRLVPLYVRIERAAAAAKANAQSHADVARGMLNVVDVERHRNFETHAALLKKAPKLRASAVRAVNAAEARSHWTTGVFVHFGSGASGPSSVPFFPPPPHHSTSNPNRMLTRFIAADPGL
jgi:hypothetical protein